MGEARTLSLDDLPLDGSCQPGPGAVLLDLTMPRMDGVEAFREMRLRRPEVPVLLMSGYNEQDAIQRFTGKGLAGFVRKPFETKSLAEKIATAIRGVPDAGA